MNLLNKDLAMDLFQYKNGNLIRKVAVGPNAEKGRIAGFNYPNGYRGVNIEGTIYGVHRIIFLMHRGYLPKIIDHIDGDPSNNKIENLRECTTEENLHNSKIYKNNTSGVKGVHWHKIAKKWCARIRIKGKRIYVGIFSSIDDAEQAIIKKRNDLHGEFANHGT